MRTLPLLLAACLAALPAAAKDAVLVKATGKVWVKADGTEKFVKAQEGALLLYGDTVRVGKKSVAQLTLGPDAVVLVREETEFLIGGSAGQTELDFSFGEFLVGLRKRLTQKQSFRVRTPAAVAAIRGTLFWGRSDKKDKSTTYAGFGGKVRVEAQGQAVEVTPGKTVTVAFGAAPADPAPSTVTLDYAGKFMVDGSLQGLEALARETEPEDVPPAPKPKRVKKKKAPKADAEPKPE